MPVVEPDSEDVVAQKEFWNCCVIGFLLDYRKFSVPRLQQLINSTRRIRGAVSIVGRELYFYIFHFEFMEDLMHTCTKGPWAVDGTLLVLERWRLNLVIGNLQLNFITIWVQFHGLPLEYQYLELAKKMGQSMCLVERVDWRDKIPRNICFQCELSYGYQ